MSTPRNPAFDALVAESPGTVAAFRDAAVATGTDVIDLGVGDPRAVVDATIRRALVDGIPDVSSYPLAAGIAEVREAVAGWARRRYGVAVDPATEVLPTHGSKEAIASFTQLVLEPGGTRDTVVVTDPGYPTPAHAARLVGGRVESLRIGPECAFVPDLASVPTHVWARTAVLWLNYPNNPTAATAPATLYSEAASLAATHGFVVASDEAYAEIHAGTRPASALEVGARDNVVVFTSLSKRSAMTGYRAGAVVAAPDLIADLRRLRAMLGLAPQVFTQKAAAAAWADDRHVDALRRSLMARTHLLRDVLATRGVQVHGGDATPFLWVRAPDGLSDTDLCRHLADRGVLVTPGSFFGAGGSGFVRIAAMAPEADCERAARLLRDFF